MKIIIKQIESNTADGIVINAHWNASLTDGEYSVSSYGSQSFTRDDESPALVPFADLTEEMVVGWLTLDEGLEANLQSQIDAQKNPTTVKGAPWDVAEPEGYLLNQQILLNQ
jgi:hypothetical protein